MSDPPRLSQAVDEALRFARCELGPASSELVADPATQALLLSRQREGQDVADAVLAEVHRCMGRSLPLANEFLSYFLADLHRMGHPLLSPGLHRFLDTGDLAHSVLGDLWPQLGALEFRGRRAFLALLSQRLRWKSSDKARRTQRLGSGEELQELDPSIADSPLTRASSRDEHERLILILSRLKERDRVLLAAYLQGKPMDEVMSALGLGYEAARKAQRRAIERARELLVDQLHDSGDCVDGR